MASHDGQNFKRTSQLVKQVTLYYKTASSTDWTRLNEAFRIDYKGINKNIRQLTQTANTENILFDGGIQIEQAAEKYNHFYKTAGDAYMTKPEIRWRVRFERGQYTNVLVTEQVRDNEDLSNRPISIIEIIFDVVHPPMSTDVSLQSPQTVSDHAGATTLSTLAEELPLAALFRNHEGSLVTQVRLLFQRPMATVYRRRWSWPAVIQFLQGSEVSEKPPTVSEVAWEDITTGTLNNFVTSGLDHAGLVLDGDYLQVPK